MGGPHSDEYVANTKEIETFAGNLYLAANAVSSTRIRVDDEFVEPMKEAKQLSNTFPAEAAPLRDGLDRFQYGLWESLREAIHSLLTFSDATRFHAYATRVDDEDSANDFLSLGGRRDG